jgi:hypothetical protein
MATRTSMNPYRAHDSSVSVYQVPEFVVGGEKLLFYALYGNEAYEKLRKSFYYSVTFLKKVLLKFYLFLFFILMIIYLKAQK